MKATTLQLALGIVALCLGHGIVSAQPIVDSSVTERIRQVEQERRTGLATTENYLKTTGQDRHLSGWGAWFTNTYIDFSDDDRNSRTKDPLESLTLRDLRLWYTTQIGRKFTAYARLKTQNFDFDTATGITKPNFNILEGVDLDMGYLEFRPDYRQRIRAGRQFTQIGRGFILADILDGVLYQRVQNGWNGQVFYGTTPNRVLNLDSSIVGFNQGLTHRDFVYGTLEYTHRAGNRYYVFHMGEVDRSQTTDPTQAAVDFHYNANYTGVGGQVRVTPRVLLLTEGGFQGGRTLSDATSRRVGISASYFDALGLWNLRGRNDSLIQAEYAYGSGDPDRSNVSDTFGSLRNASTDTNFLYFGRVETGLALSPRLSNLHMIRAGYQQRIRLKGPNLQATDPLVGVKLTEYYKDHASGAISDVLASGTGKHVGDALDTYVAWRIWSDTTLNAQYGHFGPGNAYPVGTRSSTDRFLLSTTYSF